MTMGRNSIDIIIIVIIFDSLYSDFEITIASILKIGDKTIEKIQNITQFKKAKYKAKRLTSQLEDATMAIAMAFHKGNNFPKQMANNDDKYYNYYQKGYYSWDC